MKVLLFTRNHFCNSIATLMFFVLAGNLLNAATITSNGTGGGTWATGATWVGGVAPAGGDNAIIAVGDIVTLGASVNITGSLTVTGILRLVGFDMTAGDIQGAGTISSSSGTPTLTSGSDNTSTIFSGVIGTGAITFIKSGTGTLTLSGTNTYTGLTTISAGTLKLGSTGALGTTAGATVVSSGAVLDLNGINYSAAEGLTIAGTGIANGGCIINSSATAATFAGDISLSTTTPQITASNPITLSGIISGGNINSTNSLIIAGNNTLTGVLTLSGNNTYTGVTTVNAGAVVKIGADNALGAYTSSSTNNSTIITAGGVIDLNGITYTANEYVELDGTGISSSGAMINSSATTANFACEFETISGGTITADNPIILSGVVQFTGGVNNDLTKAGSSTLTLTSSTGTKTNNLFITAGTLVLGIDNAVGNSGNTTISSGAVFDFNGHRSDRPFTSVNGTGISGGGAITNSSATTATCFGTITLASNASIGGAGGLIDIPRSINGAGFGLTLSGAVGGTISDIISGASTTVTKIDAGSWTLSAANTYTGGTILNAGLLNVNNATAIGSGAFTINGGTFDNTSGASITLTNNNTQNWNGNFTFAGTQPLNMGTGAVTFSANRQVTVTTSTLTILGTVNESGYSLTKAGAGTLSFGSQNITLSGITLSAGNVNLSSSSFYLSGNFTNSSNFNFGTGTVIFNGTTNQTISGSAMLVYDLVVNKTGTSGNNVVTLATPITVSNTLTLTDGILATDATNLLTLTNTSSSATTGGNSSGPSFVKGPIRWNGLNGAGPFIFPTGAGTSSWARVAVSGVTVPTDFTCQYFNTSHSNVTSTDLSTTVTPTLTTVSNAEYWDVARTSGAGNAAVTLYWENAAASGINSCANNGDLKVAHYNTSAGSKWENANSSGTIAVTGSCSGASSGTVKSDVMTSFSPFSFGSGSGGVNPLPIELLTFSAVYNGTTTDINWKTASEINNNYFTVERSTDGINFIALGNVASKAVNGNSTSELTYTLNDPNTFPGVYYYRLKQTDFDSKYIYSNVAVVNIGKHIDFKFELAPNPNDGNSMAGFISAPIDGMATFKIYDVAGNRLHLENIPVKEGEENPFKIQFKENLDAGTYIVICILNEDTTTKKLMTVKK